MTQTTRVPPADPGQTPAPGGPSSPADGRVAVEPESVARLCWEFVRQSCPETVSLKLVLEVATADGGVVKGSIPLIEPVPMGETAEDALAILRRLKPEQWMGAAALAAELDLMKDDREFKDAIAELKAAKKISSNRRSGYQVKKPPSAN